jgi:hypothetical protein
LKSMGMGLLSLWWWGVKRSKAATQSGRVYIKPHRFAEETAALARSFR